MRALEIKRPAVTRSEGGHALSARLDDGRDPFDLWYESSAGPVSSTGEPFIAAVSLAAMQAGLAVKHAGPVSTRLRGALPTISAIWQQWLPELHPLTIQVAAAAPASSSTNGGVGCFFSGGVDSFYSVLKNLDEIDALIAVHGFDVPVEDRDLWERVSTPIVKAAAELGKPLILVRTNLQEYSNRFLHWRHYHGAALASVALLLSPLLRKVYVPSTHSYADLAPWGSHPLVDPLWSTESVEIVHDGAEATRVRKVELLSRRDVALRYLRVCFMTRRPEWHNVYNCGKCGKCLRTMVNLHLAGALERCATLPHVLDLEAIRFQPIENESQRSFVVENLSEARRLGADRALIMALQDSLDRSSSGLNMAPKSLETNAEMQRLEEEASRLRLAIQAVKTSRSWRITHPLRSLTDAVRRAG